MSKPLAVEVQIYEDNVNIMADIRTSDGKIETIEWTNVEERNRFMYNGYTFFYDMRALNKLMKGAK